MSEFYLYALWIGHGTPPRSVHRGNHYEVHAVAVEEGKTEEDTVHDYVWEIQKERAEGYARFFNAPNTEDYDCEEDYDIDYEEAWGEFAESFISWNAVKFDLSNAEHRALPGAQKYLSRSFLLEMEMEQVHARLDREIKKVYELQAVITEATAKKNSVLHEMSALQAKLSALIEELKRENETNQTKTITDGYLGY